MSRREDDDDVKKPKYGRWIALAVIAILALYLWTNYRTTYDNCNTKYQTALGGGSQASAAFNIASGKIKGVWAINDQYLTHERATQVGTAEARNQMLAAIEAFSKMQASGSTDINEMTRLATVAQAAFQNMATKGGLAINVAIEAYPQLRGAETTEKAMRAMEEGTNEIKTALDDWIAAIKDYNTYRNNYWPHFWASRMPFPEKINYYQGKVTELGIDSLNPVQPATPAPDLQLHGANPGKPEN